MRSNTRQHRAGRRPRRPGRSRRTAPWRAAPCRARPPSARTPRTPGAAQPGLDLVGDQQGAMGAAQPRRRRQIVVAREVHALALDRLDHERRDVAAGSARSSASRSSNGMRTQSPTNGSKRSRKVLVAVQRQRAIGQAVKGVVAEEDRRATGRGPAELDRRLDRLGAGIAEEQLASQGMWPVRRSASSPASNDTSNWTRPASWPRSTCSSARSPSGDCGRARRRQSR